MLAQPESSIVTDINTRINKEGSGYNGWYIGVTQDIDQRLSNDHNVSIDGGWWIFRRAFSDTDAREIERHFLKLGCKGGTRDGDKDAEFVYAYKMTSVTEP